MTVHQLRRIDDHHLVATEPGGEADGMDELADLVDDNLAAIRPQRDFSPVRMAAGNEEPAGLAGPARRGARPAQKHRGEPGREHRLSVAARATQQQRVRHARGLDAALDPLPLRAVPRQALRDHSNRSVISRTMRSVMVVTSADASMTA